MHVSLTGDYYRKFIVCNIQRVESKTCRPTFVHNFDKYRTISKILSLLNSASKFATLLI